MCLAFCFFKQKTAYEMRISDWSSDVCSSDLTNVNTASAAELDAVPGLNGHGPEIVRYSEERGGFSDLRHLEEVLGLAGKVDGSSAALTVGDATCEKSMRDTDADDYDDGAYLVVPDAEIQHLQRDRHDTARTALGRGIMWDGRGS